jgi:hypothetical protein
VNVQVIADPAGRLVWISPVLPGARHAPLARRRQPQRRRPCCRCAGRARPRTVPAGGRWGAGRGGAVRRWQDGASGRRRRQGRPRARPPDRDARGCRPAVWRGVGPAGSGQQLRPRMPGPGVAAQDRADRGRGGGGQVAFSLASRPTVSLGFGVDPRGVSGCEGHALRPGPYPPDLSRAVRLRGFYHRFTHVPPSDLPCRTRPVWQYRNRPGVRAAFRPPGAPRVRLPPASPHRCADAVERSSTSLDDVRLVAHKPVELRLEHPPRPHRQPTHRGSGHRHHRRPHRQRHRQAPRQGRS